MSPAPCSRSPFTAAVAALVCAALAVTPAAAQVKADGTPVETSPAPTVKTDHTARDAAVAAGVVAVGTALWLRHRAEAKKKEEAAAAAAAAAAPKQPVETPAPAPATTTAAAEPAPAPEVVTLAPTPAPVVKKPEPVLDIALDVGFGDLSEFTRRFRDRFGRPPAAFRRSYGRARSRL